MKGEIVHASEFTSELKPNLRIQIYRKFIQDFCFTFNSIFLYVELFEHKNLGSLLFPNKLFLILLILISIFQYFFKSTILYVSF